MGPGNRKEPAVLGNRNVCQRKERISTKPPTTPLLSHLHKNSIAPQMGASQTVSRGRDRGDRRDPQCSQFDGRREAIHSRQKVRASRWLKSRGGVASESKDRSRASRTA